MAINVVEILVKAKDMTEAGFAESEATAGGFGKRIQAVGALAAGALVAVGAEAAKMAINFNSAMEQLVTQAGVSNAKLAVLKQGVLQLAAQVGESPDSLAASLYHVASNMQSMGATAPQMLNAVKIAAEGAKVGGADLVDVTNALTAAIASGMKGTQNFSQAMGVLNATVGTGDMKMQDLADAFGTGMLATVKGFGVTITDVGAALATFGDNNIRGAKAGTDLRMAVQALAAPAKAGVSVLNNMGLSATKLARDMQAGGLNQAITDLKKHMDAAGLTAKQQGEVITEAFGKKAGTGVNILVGQFARLESKYPDLAKGANNFGEAWKNTQAQVKQQLSQLVAGFQALMITIGEKLIPVIQKVVSWMLQHKQITVILLAAIGALVAGLVALAAATWAVNVAMDANPVMLVVLAIAALAAGVVYAYTHFQAFRNIVDDVGRFFVSVWNGAVHAAGAVIRWFTDGPLKWIQQQVAVVTSFWRSHLQEIKDVTSFIWKAISTVIQVAWAVIKGILQTALGWLKAAWGVAWAVIYGTVKTVWNLIGQDIHAALQFITGVIGIALDLVTGHWSKAWHDMLSLGKSLLGDIINMIKTGVSGFGSLLYNAGKALVTGLINGIKSMFGAIGSAVSSVAHKVAGFFGLSPAIEGPLSGGGAPEIRGRHFADALAGGVRAGIPGAGSAAGALAGALVPRGPGGPAGGGAGPLVIEFHMPAGALMLPPEFWTAFAEGIRVRGGSREIINHKVVLA